MSKIQLLFSFFSSVTTPHLDPRTDYIYCSDERQKKSYCSRAGSQIRGDMMNSYLTSPWPLKLWPLNTNWGSVGQCYILTTAQKHTHTHPYCYHIHTAIQSTHCFEGINKAGVRFRYFMYTKEKPVFPCHVLTFSFWSVKKWSQGSATTPQ